MSSSVKVEPLEVFLVAMVVGITRFFSLDPCRSLGGAGIPFGGLGSSRRSESGHLELCWDESCCLPWALLWAHAFLEVLWGHGQKERYVPPTHRISAAPRDRWNARSFHLCEDAVSRQNIDERNGK